MDSMQSVRRLRLAALAGVLLAALGAGEAAGQLEPEGLFLAVERAAGIDARGGSTPSDSLTIRQRLVSIDFGQLSAPIDRTAAGRTGLAAGPSGVLRLNLFDDASFTALVERSEPTFSGGYALSGQLADIEMGTVTLVVNGDVVAGTVRTPEATYRIRSAGNGLHTVSQVDLSQLPPPGEPILRSPLGSDSPVEEPPAR